jgi:hypothetical protein
VTDAIHDNRMSSKTTDVVGVLVVRAWLEDHDAARLRVRITDTLDVDKSEKMVSTAATVDDVCSRVRDWLTEFIGDGSR